MEEEAFLEMGDQMVPNVIQVLQGIDGYEAFEQRRQNKFSKAIDGNAMIKQGGVDEGVDVQLM